MSGHEEDPRGLARRASIGGAEQRRQGRSRDDVAMFARLRLAGQQGDGFLVSVRNVSSGGLMAELPHPVAPDSAVEIELAGLGWVGGRVAWQIERRVGIAFDGLIDTGAIQHH